MDKAELDIEFEREKMASKYLRHFPEPEEVNFFIAGGLRSGYLEYDGRGSIRLSKSGIERNAATARTNADELNYHLDAWKQRGCTPAQLEEETKTWAAQHERDERQFVMALIKLGKKPPVL